MRACRRGLIGLALAAPVGCATTAVQATWWNDDPSSPVLPFPLYIYGGTVTDAVAVAGAVAAKDDAAIGVLLIFDLPLSFAADTLLLPLSIWQQIDRSNWTEERFLPRLADHDPDQRAKAAAALGALAGTTKRTIDALTRALADPEPTVRDAAATALERIRGR